MKLKPFDAVWLTVSFGRGLGALFLTAEIMTLPLAAATLLAVTWFGRLRGILGPTLIVYGAGFAALLIWVVTGPSSASLGRHPIFFLILAIPGPILVVAGAVFTMWGARHQGRQPE